MDELTTLRQNVETVRSRMADALAKAGRKEGDVLLFAASKTRTPATVRLSARLDILSMGMSDDFAAAILEGSTMVRVGTAIYGARYYPPKATV